MNTPCCGACARPRAILALPPHVPIPPDGGEVVTAEWLVALIPVLTRWLIRLGYPQLLAERAVDRVVDYLLRHLLPGRKPLRLRRRNVWLFVVTSRAAARMAERGPWRKKKTGQASAGNTRPAQDHGVRVEDMGYTPADPDADDPAEARRVWVRQVVDAALTPAQRLAVTHSVMLGWPEAEVVALAGKSRSTVRTQREAGLARLRAALALPPHVVRVLTAD